MAKHETPITMLDAEHTSQCAPLRCRLSSRRARLKSPLQTQTLLSLRFSLRAAVSTPKVPNILWIDLKEHRAGSAVAAPISTDIKYASGSHRTSRQVPNSSPVICTIFHWLTVT